MTAKEALRDKVENMSEDEAARLLEQLEAEDDAREYHPMYEAARKIMKDVRREDLADLPPSSDVDRVVYGKLA
jgi:dsDNA-specific endonuclease/ATPase MutS2